MKKIYIAGKFEERERIRALYEIVKAKGYEIGYDWTVHERIKPYTENQDKAEAYFQNEIKGIAESDVFIYLSHDVGHTLHMEFGAALMSAKLSGKPLIYAIGESNDLSPWFFNASVKRCETIETVLQEL